MFRYSAAPICNFSRNALWNNVYNRYITWKNFYFTGNRFIVYWLCECRISTLKYVIILVILETVKTVMYRIYLSCFFRSRVTIVYYSKLRPRQKARLVDIWMMCLALRVGDIIHSQTDIISSTPLCDYFQYEKSFCTELWSAFLEPMKRDNVLTEVLHTLQKKYIFKRQ